MTEQEQQDIVHKVLLWLDIHDDPEHKIPVGYSQRRTDAAHSALLSRLLEGKPPLPQPPPRAFSYPWYKLIDDGKDENCEVCLGTGYYKGQVIINQAPWNLISQVSETEFLVEWAVTKLRARVWKVHNHSSFCWNIEVLK